MKLNIQKPRNFINPLLSRKSVDENTFIAFKTNFEEYKHKLDEQINTKQTEPNIVTNALKPFVDSFGYQGEPYSQKGQISIDLAIMQGITPTVLIEAKMPNSNDMITEGDLNKKSFHQAVLYFMNERVKNNKTLFHIIITDFNNWFIFDAKDFDRLFWNNSRIRKLHEALITQALLGDRTEDFYSDLAKELPNLKKDLFEPELIDCAHFNIRLKSNEKELTAIYKLLSADCLLKAFNPNDANSLNKEFYSELLYILGLEETKEKGKKIIGRAKNPQNGTLYENISNKLGQYQKNNDFESVIKLIIIWINRILFLKLLESQIVKWSGTQKFLSPKTLDQYDQLETLFFEVLAKPVKSRSVREYDHVPYLNSSLFEIHPDERAGITIATMADNIEIDYYARTVVKDGSNHRKTGKVSTLPYLLAFLDAYDFANDSDEELTNTHKTLISASVLGLIFEKINGYKDGSFYTPSFITMYMARETIEKAVIEKFNQIKGWKCKTLTDVHNKISDLTEANSIINSIKICDPAVGSGHFLVSALNELLRIKSELGVLVDVDGMRIKDYHLSIENDELIIRSDEGEQFEYKRGSTGKTRIQKTMFKEKQTLIESCLFGVDINPNSVNICRLRLWVELLKNAYYRENGELDTLPNIDINIKCGNSLISRFSLSDGLNSKTIKNEIQDYKDKVRQYKENVGSKQDVMQAISNIKAKFQQTLKSSHETTKKLNNSLMQYVAKYSFDGLTTLQKHKAIEINLLGKQVNLFGEAEDKTEKTKLKKALESSWLAVEEIESGKIYQDAFEWRFEFPEVLNEAGDFVGFDVVIGNPPYFNIDTFGAGSPMLRYFPQYYSEIYMDKSDILFYFIALASKISATQTAFIVSNAMLFSEKATKLRNYLLSNNPIRKLINFEQYQVFDEASITSMMLFLDKNHQNLCQVRNFPEPSYDKTELVSEIENKNAYFDVEFSKDAPFALVDITIATLNQKIDGSHPLLGDVLHLGSGMQTAANEVFCFDIYPAQFDSQFIKKRMTGEIIERYTHLPAQEFLLYIENVDEFVHLPESIQQHLNNYNSKLAKRAEIKRNTSRKWWKYSFPMHKDYYEHRKIWCSYRAKENTFCLDETNNFIGFTNTTVIFDTHPDLFDIKYVLALLNSKVLNFRYKSIGKQTGSGIFEYFENQISKLPLVQIELNKQKPFIEKVDAIMTAKQKGEDTSELEAELDDMVCALYNLSPDDIAVIDSSQVTMAAS